MKKLSQKFNVTSMLLVIALTVLLVVPTFAAGTTMESKGYLWEGISEEDIANSQSHFSVSNVIDTFTIEGLTTTQNHGFIVDGSTTITLIAEDGVMFDAYELTDREKFEYDYMKPLPVSGQATVSIYNQETGEVTSKTVDTSELNNYDDMFPGYLPGCTITLDQPGDYYVRFRYEAREGAAEAVVIVKESATTEDAAETTQEEVQEPVVENVVAQPTASKVLVNGTDTSFDAYNIKGNNYFKIRDLANVVSGSEKQFDVTWDNEKKVINLVSNKAYTVVGGEMAKGDGQEKNSVTNTSPIYKDGELVQLAAYTIDGNNYFKLRDIGALFNFGVTWNNETKTVGIDTAIGYVAP